ncbi:MAG: hypothetical protein K5877_05150 [Lachnospiraceae bacterium]|nr:hypothetical protein [Lachnospiraceae bacterium]
MDFFKGRSCRITYILILACTFICMSIFVFIQPFGDGPDEINRYKVVSYIENHGHIPRGEDPEIIIDGYGASYAFQPILTYMIEGYILHALSPLHPDPGLKLIIARYVNVIIGLIAAYFTLKLSKELFKDPMCALMFALGVIFLPQNIFVYTYVNTDGMGLLSVILMIYGTIKGYRTDFDRRSLISLCTGIILCLMSYYNCYGYILTAFIAFVVYFVMHGSYKEMLSKGLLIVLFTALFAGWWFIRNMILYNGDIFALTARRECADATGNILWLENMRNTYKVQGYSLKEMVFGTDYYTLVWKSFIAMFGPMAIPTHHYVYMSYKYLTCICILGLFIPQKTTLLQDRDKKDSLSFLLTLFTGMLIPAALALYYSYSWDFQPQGRYYLPCLIPLAMILCVGMEKLISLIKGFIYRLTQNKKTSEISKVFLYFMIYVFFFMSLVISIYKMISYYSTNS